MKQSASSFLLPLCKALLSLFAASGAFLLLPPLASLGMGAAAGALAEEASRRFSAQAALWLLALAALFFLYKREAGVRPPLTASLLGGLFSLFFVLGQATEVLGGISTLFTSAAGAAGAGPAFLGYFFLWRAFFSLFFRRKLCVPQKIAVPLAALYGRVAQKHPVRGPFLALCLAWLPVWLLAFPGAAAADTHIQIVMASLPDKVFNDHYPYLTTLLYKGVLELGKAAGAPNAGLFFLVVMQYLWLAFALARLLHICRRLTDTGALSGGFLLVFCFLPLWPTYAVNVQKDTLFVGAAVLLSCLAAELVCLQKTFSARSAGLALALTLVLCVTRSNGLIIALPFWLGLALCLPRRERLRAAAVAVGAVAFTLFSQNVLRPLAHCSRGETQEMLSLPFQMTARTVKLAGEDVTAEERQAIDGILLYNELPSLYEPNVSDPVKMPYRYRFTMSWDTASEDYKQFRAAEKAALERYFAAWLSMGLRHPDLYVDAAANMVHGYVYPTAVRLFGAVELNTSIDEAHREGVITWTQPGPGSLRLIYSRGASLVGKLPFFSLLFHPCVSAWALCLCLGGLLRRRRFTWLPALVPALVTLAVCLAGPINACARYALPVTAVVPLLLALLSRSEAGEV